MGEPEGSFDTLAQNSHGNNSLKQSHILLTELHTEGEECWEGLEVLWIRSGN